MSMKSAILALSAAGLVACTGAEPPKTPSASNFDLTVGQTVSKTVADVAKLAQVANFVPVSITVMNNGTYGDCTYDTTTHTLTVKPKTANIEAPTDTCTIQFADANGMKL
jgi:hypothetical protein